jgi:hypothetical protein
MFNPKILMPGTMVLGVAFIPAWNASKAQGAEGMLCSDIGTSG